MKKHINCACGARYMRKLKKCPECGSRWKRLRTIRWWYYRRCLRKASGRLHQSTIELYLAKTTMPHKEEDINQVLEELVYPAGRALDKMHEGD